MIYSKIIVNILNFFDYFQQKKIIKFFKKNIKNEIILFDIGSHFGETVKLFNSNFRLKEFHCFEASPLNFKILSQNIDKYNFKIIYKLNNFGIGSNNENNFINQTKESSSSTINELNLNSKYFKKKLKILNVKKTENFYEKIPIKLVTLDNYITNKNQKKIDILKIDTEGFELNVIKGLKKTHNIVKYIYFEHHYDDMIKKNYTFRDINYILKKFGFKKVFKSKMIFRKSFEYIYENSHL